MNTSDQETAGAPAGQAGLLQGRRVLITGATGQVARPIAEALSTRNEVWAAARFRDTAARGELERIGIQTAPFVLGDADLSHLPDVDFVIHCAADVDPKTTDAAMSGNAEGTGFLMQRYADAEAFFHMSSASVYQPQSDPTVPVAEDAPLGGVSTYSPHYAMSKLVSESVVRFQARALKLPTVIARLDVAYGTRGHGGLPMVLYELMKHQMAFVKRADADSHCTVIHEDDITRQVEALLARAATPATIVNLAGDDIVTLEEIITYLEEITGLSMPIEHAEDPAWPTQVIDNTKRLSLAGPCQIPWREGVRSALAVRHPDAIT